MQTLKVELEFPDEFNLEESDSVRTWMCQLFIQTYVMGLAAKFWINGREVNISVESITQMDGREPS